MRSRLNVSFADVEGLNGATGVSDMAGKAAK